MVLTGLRKYVVFFLCSILAAPATVAQVFPGQAWQRQSPDQVGLRTDKLEELSRLVGGRGCVIRFGYLIYSWGDISVSEDIASAVKPLISHLLLTAVQEGRLRSVDDPVSNVEPRLRALQRDSIPITWRHLASQTSGYGLIEAPGTAWAYNDYALALYYDSLMFGVFQERGDEVLRSRLAEPLRFQDPYTFEAFGPEDRPGRLAVSVRDFARFALLYLRGGRWEDKQLLEPELIDMALSSPIARDLPLTSGKDTPMLPGQRSLGGGKNITTIGPGCYSFNWWLNRLDSTGRRLYVDAPPDTYVASGHGGRRMLWIIPSLDLVVSWNDSSIHDHDDSPGNPDSLVNQAARLIVESVIPRKTRLEIRGQDWYLDGRITNEGSQAEGLLMNVRMVNSTFEDRSRTDFDPEANTNRFIRWLWDYAANGVRAFTLNLQGGMPGYEGALNSAYNSDGSLRPEYLERVRRVIEACREHGVGVILGYFYQRQDQHLEDADAIRKAVVETAHWIRQEGFTHVILEIANEYAHPGFDHEILRSPEGQVELVRLAQETHPDLAVSTAGMGNGRIDERIAEAVDFILIHFNNTPVEEIPDRIDALKRFGKPIVCNEDDKIGEEAIRAARASVENGASWGFMHSAGNQYQPFIFRGRHDDPPVYQVLSGLTAPSQ